MTGSPTLYLMVGLPGAGKTGKGMLRRATQVTRIENAGKQHGVLAVAGGTGRPTPPRAGDMTDSERAVKNHAKSPRCPCLNLSYSASTVSTCGGTSFCGL